MRQEFGKKDITCYSGDMEGSRELTVWEKVKVVCIMSLAGVSITTMVGGGVIRQRRVKARAKVTGAEQLKNVESLKTSFPAFAQTETLKEFAENMPIKAIKLSETPLTFTADLDASISPNPSCETYVPDMWLLQQNGNTKDSDYNGSAGVSNWTIYPDGTVKTPSLTKSDIGRYTFKITRDELCGAPEDLERETRHYTFKVIPD